MSKPALIQKAFISARRRRWIVGGLVLVVVLVAVVLHLSHPQEQPSPQHKAVAAPLASTPCYVVGFVAGLGHPQIDACSTLLDNPHGPSGKDEIFSIDGLSHPDVTAASFDQYMQTNAASIVSSLNTSTTSYSLVSSHGGTFAGSPAYYLELELSNGAHEEDVYVYHETTVYGLTYNIFQVTAQSRGADPHIAPLSPAVHWK